MALVIFGCGADCTAGVIADVRTGKVYSFPLSGEVYYRKELDFELQSRLLTAQWVSNGYCVRQKLVWEGTEFSFSDVKIVGGEEECKGFFSLSATGRASRKSA